MSNATKSLNQKVLELSMPQDSIEAQLVRWVRGVVKSNHELVPALERLQRSYKVLLAGKPVTDAEEVLWQVEGALRDAKDSANFICSHDDHEPHGG